jgi:hypothetical protein
VTGRVETYEIWESRVFVQDEKRLGKKMIRTISDPSNNTALFYSKGGIYVTSLVRKSYDTSTTCGRDTQTYTPARDD